MRSQPSHHLCPPFIANNPGLGAGEHLPLWMPGHVVARDSDGEVSALGGDCCELEVHTASQPETSPLGTGTGPRGARSQAAGLCIAADGADAWLWQDLALGLLPRDSL